MRTRIVSMRRIATVVAALGAASWATGGQAQQTGTYAGTSADGNSMSFTVDIDPNTGLYEFTGAGLFFTALCRKSGIEFTTGWGFGLGQDIVSGNNNVLVNANSYNYFYLDYNMHFTTAGVLTGKISSRTAVFDPGNPPTVGDFCISPTQSFTATYQGPGRDKPLPAGTVVNYGNVATSSH